MTEPSSESESGNPSEEITAGRQETIAFLKKASSERSLPKLAIRGLIICAASIKRTLFWSGGFLLLVFACGFVIGAIVPESSVYQNRIYTAWNIGVTFVIWCFYYWIGPVIIAIRFVCFLLEEIDSWSARLLSEQKAIQNQNGR